MANSPSLAKSGRSAAKFGDLRRRAMFLLLALIVYRIGAHIPVPGIDPDQLAKLFQSQSGGILGMFNMFSGGALSRFTIFALGIMPYISASIIMQLMSIVSPQMEALKKEGQAGQRKITQYTRYLHGGSGDVPGFRYCGRAGKSAWAGARSRHGVPVDDGGYAGDRHDVPDVAGRADHGTRSGQRHFDHHFRRYRGGFPECDRWSLRTGSHRLDEHHLGDHRRAC